MLECWNAGILRARSDVTAPNLRRHYTKNMVLSLKSAFIPTFQHSGIWHLR
jgi:hypothetical protein